MTAEKQVVPAQKKPRLVAKMADRFGIDPDKLLTILKATAFKQSDNKDITNEQMAALLVVADQYGLNPFTREIYAFADKRAGIVPIVGVDGWSRIINEHPQSDGFEFRQSETLVTPEGGKPCPEWMEVIIHRKDRAHPIIVREYIDEVYRPPFVKDGRTIPGPWQTHTKRFFRHKVLIQGSRIAYGFSGIYDEDEAQRIVEMGAAEVVASSGRVFVPPDIADQYVRQIRSCLAANDAVGLAQLDAEFSADELAAMWGKLDSTERSSIKKLQATLKPTKEEENDVVDQ